MLEADLNEDYSDLKKAGEATSDADAKILLESVFPKFKEDSPALMTHTQDELVNALLHLSQTMPLDPVRDRDVPLKKLREDLETRDKLET